MFYNDVLYLHLSFTGIIHLNIIYLFIISASILSVRPGVSIGRIPAHLLGLLLKKNYLHICFKCTE